MADILHEVTIAEKPEVAYKAITEKQRLESWCTTDVITAKPEVGFVNLIDLRRLR